LQITATLNGKSTTVFLGKSVNADVTSDAKAAATCSLQDTKLLCEGKPMGVAVAMGPGGTDMGAFEAVNPQSQKNAIYSGFHLDANNNLHWQSKDFEKLMGGPHMKEEKNKNIFPDGGAAFALFNSFVTGGQTKFFVNLGCTDPMHLSLHGDLHMGAVKAVAV
jgi:hypothetical protein